MKKTKDVKFIIYQALYIFVVCVVAIKGANLDLAQVITDDGKPKVTLTPEQMDSIQQLLDKSVIVDTARFVIVPKELLEQDKKLQQIVQNMPKVDLNNYVLKSEVPKPIEEKIKEPDQKTEKEIVIGNVELFQYHQNSVNNQGDNAITINGKTIPAHSVGTVVLNGEQTVVIQAGDKTKTVSVKENKKPSITFQRMTTMNEDTKVTTLQRSVGYRVTINDDFPDQLDVKFGGAVTVKKVSVNTFDVTLNAFSSKGAFDTYTENKSAPYNIGFTVTVSDNIAPHKITGQNVFIFGDY